ncbi:MAG: transglutaminase TgpA family protein [Telluria sp.]
MKLATPLSRDKADTLLLLLSTVLVLAPHTAHLPLWVTLLCAATLGWRASITLRGRRMPPALLLLPLAAVSMAGVIQTYHTLLGRDAGVAMLVLLVAFKTLEMHARRDLYVVVFLCFFLVLTDFFYSQAIGTALMMIASVLALLTTQVSFQFTGKVPPLKSRLLLGARMLGLAVPIALVLFVVFPRVQGPLWGMPGDANSGRGGLADHMAPGLMSHLAQSDDVAFRVKFDGGPPPQPQLYWRGPVFGAFDGQSWTRVQPHAAQTPQSLSLSVRGQPRRYQVTLEPSNARWLFTLEMPDRLPHLDENTALVSPELELTAAAPIDKRIRYDAESYTQFSLQPAQLDAPAEWLALPAGLDPRALADGMALRQEPDPGKRIATILRRFARENFVYTLDPPALGANSIDEFLYQTRAGFCEHYAGAFVFLMRAAGIPARVVTGYQGGELNPLDGYLTVRQSDAHAWAEVWLAGRGWVRFDPTAAVAPERIRRNLARALPPPAPFGIEGLGRLMQLDASGNPLLAQFRFAMSAVNNGWNQWVLNYTPERQRGLLAALAERLFDWRMGIAFALLSGVLFFSAVLRRRSRLDPVDALYSALCKRLGQLGVGRAIDEGPNAFAERVAISGLGPERQAAATEFLHHYSAFRYGRHAQDANLVPHLKRLLSQLR